MSRHDSPKLPLGQQPRPDFPRFGLTPYATRFPSRPNDPAVTIKVLSADPIWIDDALADLPRTAQTADFHCVTTWSHLGLQWSGVRFADFFRERVAPLIPASTNVVGVVFRAQDGYKTALLLEDLMAQDVLLANELNGQPLTVAHGAPLRLVAPQHYGYKSLKHVEQIEFYPDVPIIKRGIRGFLDHPRARVALEERGQWLPGWLLRRVYRRFIPKTVAQFRAALEEHERKQT